MEKTDAKNGEFLRSVGKKTKEEVPYAAEKAEEKSLPPLPQGLIGRGTGEYFGRVVS